MSGSFFAMTRARGTLVGAVAAVTAAAMVLLVAPSPGFAVNPDSLDNQAQIVQVGDTGFAVPKPAVPDVESLLGRGAPLATAQQVAADPGLGRVALGSQAAAAKSALVRVTLLDPAADTVVLTTASLSSLEDNDGTGKVDPNNALEFDAVPTALLHAAAGTSASTTVLLPVAEGGVQLFADQAGAAVRVETLATFAAGKDAPGATIALPAPELRADSAQGLGGVVDADGLWIGLTGAGSMEGELVRSLYVNLDLTLDTGGDVELSDGQTLRLPKGRSIVTTIIEPDAAGGVTLDVSRGSASLRASVLGWVTEAGPDFSSANVNGSYVVSVEAPREISFKPGKNTARVSLSGNEDADYALALVNGTVSARGETTTLTSLPVTGRASGAVVDRAAGAGPQLELVPVTDGKATFTLRRSAADVTVQPLGALLGEPTGYDKQNPATIKITSPKGLTSIDLSDHGYFTLEGEAHAGANAIDRVEITARDDAGVNTWLGIAELDFDDDKVMWRLDVLAPEDGNFDYTATVFDRSNRGKARASDNLFLDVTVPDASDEVTSPNLVVIDSKMPQPRSVDERTLAFPDRPPLEPGDLVVAPPMSGAEGGFYGEVVQLNQVDGEWFVSTVEADLAQMVFQSDVEETVEYDEDELKKQIEVTDVPNSGADPSAFVTGDIAFEDEAGNLGPAQPIGYEVADPAGPPAGAESVEFAAAAAPVEEWPGDLPNGGHAQLLTGDDVDLDLSADDFKLAEAGLDPNNPEDFAIGCTDPGSGGQEPSGDDLDEDGKWPGPISPVNPPSGVVPACGQLRSGIDFKSTWSVGANAKFLVGLKNGKPRVMNATKAEAAEFKKWEKSEAENGLALGVEGAGEISATLEFRLKVGVSWNWRPWKTKVEIKDFTISQTNVFKANAALSLLAYAESRVNLQLKLAEIQLPTLTFAIGLAPVYVMSRLDFGIAFKAEVQANVTIPAVGVERVDQTGFSFSTSQGLRRIKNDPAVKFVAPLFQENLPGTKFEFSGKVSAGPEIALRTLVYGLAGPNITISAGAGVSGTITRPGENGYDTTANIRGYLDFGLVGKAKLAFLRWDFFDFTLFALGYELQLYSRSWDFNDRVTV